MIVNLDKSTEDEMHFFVGDRNKCIQLFGNYKFPRQETQYNMGIRKAKT